MEPDELYRIQVRELKDYAMFMLDPQGTVTTWNKGVQVLFGYTEEEWLGQHGKVIFTPVENAQEVFETEMQRARESGSSTDIRWHLRKDKSEFFANGFMNVVKDDKGEVVGYAKVISDETARKRLQDSLTESNAALEQFAWVASHDLQEPLRTMGAFSQLLMRKYAGQLDEDANRILSFISNAAARMKGMVEDLLTYARITTEVERPSSVALDEDLETAISHLSQSVQESGARITHDALPVLRADRGQMVRLFQNLVGNALKYHKPDQPPAVHVTAERNGSEWVFSVRDNGIGFDPQYASLIFAPFKRLHPASEYTGTGVGLAICNRIVTAMGGRIWAESVPGEGSTFYFALPAEGRAPLHRTPRINLPPGLDEKAHGV